MCNAPPNSFATPKPRARRFRRRLGGQSQCPEPIRTRGARAMARGGWKNVAWRDHPRPTGEETPTPSGRGPALLPAKLDASPGRFRHVRPFGNRTPPSPTRRQTGGPVRRGRDLSGRRLRCLRIPRPGSPPGQGCGSNAAGRRSCRPPASRKKGAGAALASTGSGHSRRITLGLIHLDPAGPRADRGVASQASGPQVRCPRARTHRLPPARAPSAPAIRSGRKVGGSLAWGGRGGRMWGVKNRSSFHC
jgi:hypothetical protein